MCTPFDRNFHHSTALDPADRALPSPQQSRRAFLKSGAGVVASGAALQSLPSRAVAQTADAELPQLTTARRVLIKNAVVLTLDRALGDFAKADILIEDGRIREVRPDIAASDAAVIEGANRIAIPGFVDTHSHSYQGLLRSIMPNGRLDPDYNRDVQATLTPAYAPDDVYAGVLMAALGFIDMGTTAIVDLSQISHTPAHSDACISALKDSGIRAVFGYSRGIGPRSQYPQDIARLQKTYFSGADQLLTLALGAERDAKLFAAAREAGTAYSQ
jgi:5-methylthioadenosine/S-adenosylhomocysteine deaminase